MVSFECIRIGAPETMVFKMVLALALLCTHGSGCKYVTKFPRCLPVVEGVGVGVGHIYTQGARRSNPWFLDRNHSFRSTICYPETMGSGVQKMRD
jgi:hypothetical protein